MNTNAVNRAPPAPAPRGVISRELVSRYLELGAKIDALTAERMELRDLLLLAIDNGLKVAADSPFEVYKAVQDRANVP